jgi:hypothetical protein
VSREYDECRAEQALLSLEDKVELDQAIAILIELLQAGNAGSYGYDLYARRGLKKRQLVCGFSLFRINK